jgi:hypothetical protein
VIQALMFTILFLVAGLLLASSATTARDRVCQFVAAEQDLDQLPQRCSAGDIALVLVDETVGSPAGYAARICDFAAEIAIHPHTGTSKAQNVLACQFIGYVRKVDDGQ